MASQVASQDASLPPVLTLPQVQDDSVPAHEYPPEEDPEVAHYYSP